MDKRSLWVLYKTDVSNKSKASGEHPTKFELSVSHVFPIWLVHDMKLKVAVFAFFAPLSSSLTWKMSRRQFSSTVQPCRRARWRLGVDLTFGLFLEKSQQQEIKDATFDFSTFMWRWMMEKVFLLLSLITSFFLMFCLVVWREFTRFHQKLQPRDDVHVQLNVTHVHVFYTWYTRGQHHARCLFFLLVKRFLPVTLHFPDIRTSFSAGWMHFQSKTHLSLWIPELQFFRKCNTWLDWGLKEMLSLVKG